MSDNPQQTPPPQPPAPGQAAADPPAESELAANQPQPAKQSFMHRKPVQLAGIGIAGLALGAVLGGGAVAAIAHHHGPDRGHPARTDKRDSRGEMRQREQQQPQQHPQRRLPDQPPQSR